MVWACHATRQSSPNHSSRHPGGWAIPPSAEEMLDGQRQRVNSPVNARTTQNGLLQKQTKKKKQKNKQKHQQQKDGRGSPLNRPICYPDGPIGQEIELNRTEQSVDEEWLRTLFH